MIKNIRKYFLAGIAVLLPLGVTIYLIGVTFFFIDGIIGSLIELIVGFRIPGAGFAIALALVFFTGLLATNLVGRKLLDLQEKILLRIPLANSIFKITKQIVETVSRKDENVFRQVVLVEYPRPGIWVIGFLTGEARADLFGAVGDDLVKVFAPTVPNPTSGFLIIVPRKDIIPMPITVEQGLKLVLSAGIIVPNGNGDNNKNGKK